MSPLHTPLSILEGLKNRWEEKYDNGGSKKSATNLPFGRNPTKARRGSFSPATENENSGLANLPPATRKQTAGFGEKTKGFGENRSKKMVVLHLARFWHRRGNPAV
ncbi:UNVERIFIED_CONTAM: hypothetical protein Sindi_1665200 [Sesamum indicum]